MPAEGRPATARPVRRRPPSEALEGLDALAVIADNFTCAYAAGVSGTSVDEFPGEFVTDEQFEKGITSAAISGPAAEYPECPASAGLFL